MKKVEVMFIEIIHLLHEKSFSHDFLWFKTEQTDNC